MKTKVTKVAATKKKARSQSRSFVTPLFTYEKSVEEKKKIVESQLDFVYSKDSDYWVRYQENALLKLFHSTLSEVDGYKAFLKENRVTVSKIKNYSDFIKLPFITKDNYLRKYDWKKLSKKGSLVNGALVMTATSGSTGKPFYFPRNSSPDMSSAFYHQMFVRYSKVKVSKSTLVIDCFAMGVWIGGLLTYQAFKHISERGSPLTIITPGVNKKEIYDSLKYLGVHYDQIILCGYPPFIKDVVDEAEAHGIFWRDYNIRLVFAAEGFSETFRDYMVKKIGIKNLYRDIMNIYGSADIGTMAEETPVCVLIRRLAVEHVGLYTKLFGQASRLPTFAQYIPSVINFEVSEGRLYVSSDMVMPLVRYEIGDNGGVFSYKEVMEIFTTEGIDLKKEIKKAGLEDTVAELPFVFVYERTDFSTKLYGAIIYPEYVKQGLQKENLETYITGKFTMYTKFNENQDEYLEVNVELRPNISESKWLQEEVTHTVARSLIEKSAEHKNNADMMKGKVDPVIIFWPHEHESHFKTGGKHKWTKK